MRRLKRLFARFCFRLCQVSLRWSYWFSGKYPAMPDRMGATWMWFAPGAAITSGYYVHIDECETAIAHVVGDYRNPEVGAKVARSYVNGMHEHMESVIDGTYDPCDESA